MVGFILTAIPFTVWQAQKLTSFQSRGSDFSLVPYPGLTWSEPENYTVSVLLNAQTPFEKMVKANGMAVTSQTSENISESVFNFYNTLLTSKGFKLIKVIGNPQDSSNWVASYMNEGNYSEVQYYKTPYNEESSTVLLFFGTFQNI